MQCYQYLVKCKGLQGVFWTPMVLFSCADLCKSKSEKVTFVAHAYIHDEYKVFKLVAQILLSARVTKGTFFSRASLLSCALYATSNMA